MTFRIQSAPRRGSWSRARAWAADRRGVALLEFALALPVFLGFTFTGIEFANYVLANNRTQRLAAMGADLIGQQGSGTIGASEAQIYDLFSALDLTAKPFDLRTNGRIVITSVKGTDANNDGVTDNTILWQRFDGGMISALPLVGCATTVSEATLPKARRVPKDEVLIHVQVSYAYQPIFSQLPYQWLNLSTIFSRTAMFRARSKDFETPTPDARFPPKRNCTSANGL